MTQRLVSVGDDFTLPAVAKVADANLPTASKAAAIAAKLDASQKGAVSGVAPLDSGQRVPDANLPARLQDAELKAAYVQQNRAAINVLDKGAKGDGATDDRAAIQSAINSAATFGAAVYIPQGTYLLSKAPTFDYMLAATSGSRIVGEGTLKVASTAGDYRAVITGASPSTDLSGLRVEGITIDQNGSGNPATTAGSSGTLFSGNPRYAIYAGVGSHITVNGCTFRDIDSINTVAFNGPAMMDIAITDNVFYGVGASLNVHDHSTLYVSAAGQTITGNRFEGVAGGKGATTAIETHGSAQVVHSNRIRDFYVGMNITGVAGAGSDGAAVSGNTMTDVNIGISMWSMTAGTGLRQCIVHDNVIIINHDNWLRTSSDFPRGIMLDPNANVDIDTLSIHHNHIWFKPSVASPQVGELQSAGISLWLSSTTPVVKNARIESNTIIGAPSSGIRWAATGLRVRIQNNDIINPGSSSEAALPTFYKSGITIVGALTDSKVTGNRTFDDRATHVVLQGVQTSMTTATRCRQGDNEVTCTDGAVVTSFAQTIGQPFVSLDDAPQGSRFTPTLYYSPEGNRSTVATVNGNATAAPFWVSAPSQFDRIGAQVTVAGAVATVVRLGIYTDNGAGTPGALILDAGTIAGDAVASAEVTINLKLKAGLYWLVAAPQGGTPTMTCIQGTNVIGGAGAPLAIATGTMPRPGYIMTGASAALPAYYTSGGQSAAPILVALRAA